MTIIVKYSDTKTHETDFKVINGASKPNQLKQGYISKMLDSEATFVELIYPHHTEIYTLYSINYGRCQ